METRLLHSVHFSNLTQLFDIVLNLDELKNLRGFSPFKMCINLYLYTSKTLQQSGPQALATESQDMSNTDRPEISSINLLLSLNKNVIDKKIH